MNFQVSRHYFPLALLLAAVPSVSAQTGVQKEQPMAADAHPAFEVATIKPSGPDSAAHEGFPTEGHHISCIYETVDTILTVAYGIHVKQIVDAPEWFSKEHFDIDGVPDIPGVPSLDQMREMYQRLLADRFHLVLRRETREMSIYAITIAKGGPKLAIANPAGHLNTGNRGTNGQRTLKFTNMPMSAFVTNMNWYVERPVVDETSLPGRYDFTLSWTYDVARIGDADAPPSLFTAIREQLGLNLEAVKGPAPVLVIVHVEHPSEN
jgi:uncharacterized protein (TIGR03435 family)